MDRRSFLGVAIGAVGTMLLPIDVRELRADDSPKVNSRVWLACGRPNEAAAKLVEAIGGFEAHIPKNGTVLIKPNIAFPSPPTWGATSDPDFLATIIDLCCEAGARTVIVFDHPVGGSPEKNLSRSGIGEVCQIREKVKILIGDSENYFRPCKVKHGLSLKQTETAKILDKVDLFINLPTAKHHSATGVSLGLKNLMGLIWNRVPLHDEMDLNQAIADLATVIRPHLTFLEARYALTTNGPTGPGQVEEVGKYLAGFDPVAVDSIGVELARWEGRIQNGRSISHLVKAAELGVGVVERDKIELVEV